MNLNAVMLEAAFLSDYHLEQDDDINGVLIVEQGDSYSRNEYQKQIESEVKAGERIF